MPAVIVIELVRRIVNSERFATGIKEAMGPAGGAGAAADDPSVAVIESSDPSFLARAVRSLVVLTVLTAATWIVGQLVARRLSYGDEGSRDVRLAVIMRGAELHSYAQGLRSVEVVTFWSGALVDLRQASPGPDGADLELKNIMAGVEIRVPAAWRVEVEQTTAGGEFELDLPDMEALPDDAPTLRIHAINRVGGVLVTSTRE
jgi:hypothetical protein